MTAAPIRPEDASPLAEARGRRKLRDGVVVSDKMERTVVVLVQEMKAHPLYKKVVRHRSRLMAHDERGECQVGDRVRVMETRPLSRRKRWRVAAILEKAR
ncbi:MAG TPA: 30S ribosomal protein S17 [Candidatus Sulfotelmatobacter sp.]|nr:30S ribosomal protein S17 [Candidatus Sulfotelmatobacter sp.]